MSFRGLRAFRDKKQAKSFVTDPTPSSTAKDGATDNSQLQPAENPEFRYDLPASMEMKVVPGRGRAIFSTTANKPGFA